MWLCRFDLIALWFIVVFDGGICCFIATGVIGCMFACLRVFALIVGVWVGGFDDCFAGGFGGVLLLRGAFLVDLLVVWCGVCDGDLLAGIVWCWCLSVVCLLRVVFVC